MRLIQNILNRRVLTLVSDLGIVDISILRGVRLLIVLY